MNVDEILFSHFNIKYSHDKHVYAAITFQSSYSMFNDAKVMLYFVISKVLTEKLNHMNQNTCAGYITHFPLLFHIKLK